jgi:hypothetical protein
MLMCIAHWRRVPKLLQQLVWAEYRPGQENDKKASLRYMAVQRAAVAVVAHKEARPDVDEWRIDCSMRRTMCREAGVGDPLEGVTGPWD